MDARISKLIKEIETLTDDEFESLRIQIVNGIQDGTVVWDEECEAELDRVHGMHDIATKDYREALDALYALKDSSDIQKIVEAKADCWDTNVYKEILWALVDVLMDFRRDAYAWIELSKEGK